MPADLSTDDPPARTWWNSISKTPSGKDLRQAYAQEKSTRTVKSGKLTSLVSAIGFKPKKQPPTLAIQDPPPTLIQYVTTPPANPQTRPPSKSISSSRTRVDSIEPRTPVDIHRDRHSLLTLSDPDPFAGRPLIAVPVPHLPSDPNRLSAYSNPSVTDFVHKKHGPPSPKRISYASSSSHSNSYAIEIPVTEPLKFAKTSDRRQLVSKRSIGSLQFKRSEPLHRQASVTPSTGTPAHSKAGSSSTFLDPHRRSQQPPAAPPRPKLRSRGMTDSGPSKPSGFFVEEQPPQRKISPQPSYSNIPGSPQEASSSTTRVVIRQASVSRIQPPSAPPTQRLPPPPPPSALPTIPPPKQSRLDGPTISQRMGLNCRTSASSISYASSESLPGSPYGVVERDKRSSQRSGLSHGPEPESPISFVHPPPRESSRTLKKALSNQSLTRRGLSSPPLAPIPPPPMTPPEVSAEKRKQRTFHHPRLPIPPIPLPNIRSLPSSANSNAFPTSAGTSDSGTSIFDKRRGSSSATSTSSRRRLFSTSSRPSTSHHPPTTREDDTLSVFSLRSDTDSHLTPYKPWISRERKAPSASSFWEEGSSEHIPSSPARASDYSGPQAIMSRAELAKLDASIDNWSLEHSTTRSRGMSVLSASTAASDMSRDSDILPEGLSPRPPAPRMSTGPASMRMSGAPQSPSGPLSRPTSVVSEHDQHQHQHQHRQSQQQQQQQPLRQQQPRYAPSSVAAIQAASRTASPDMISLPPPPRRRKGTMVSEPDVPEDAVAPPIAPSPTTSASATPTPSLMSTMSRAPSTLKLASGSMRSRYSVEKNLHRRSIMRKPSFLNIDDDDDDSDQEAGPTMGGRMTGSDSFLDLARESFDTVRTEL